MRILPYFTNGSKVIHTHTHTHTHTPSNYFRRGSVACSEIFSRGVNPIQKLEVGNSRLFYEIKNYTRGSKFAADAGFHDNVVFADTHKFLCNSLSALYKITSESYRIPCNNWVFITVLMRI